jgi:signal transduction histidine kinase
VNQTFVDWAGASRDVLLAGTKFQTLLTIGARIYYETHYAPLLRMQGFANEIALEVVRNDGRILPVLVNSRQKRGADGAPLFNRITLFDATDRRRYERELLLARRKAEQVAKDKSDLLAMLSHDIRNPLNALMGVVQLLALGDLSDSQRRFVRLLKSSSENMLNLLNHVLELSKAESSTFALTETPFRLHTVVDDVVSTFDAAAREKGLQLRSSITDSVPSVVIGDPVAMRQILSNLIGNAVKFTSAGSVTLTVETHQISTDAVTLAFAVSDTGIGIAAEEIDRIFNEFTQARYDTAMQFGGTGLGLTIAKRLLELYGSVVQVHSTPGEGSTFSFNLRLPVPPDSPVL